jgi:hypothetical protein
LINMLNASVQTELLVVALQTCRAAGIQLGHSQ